MSLWTNKDWSPMLLNEIDKPFNSKDYIYELKFDGQRAIIFVGPNYFKIMNRHKKDITSLYPELKNIQKLIKVNTIFDGEIIALDNNKPSFSKLQDRSHLKNTNKIKIQSELNPVLFIAFDILYQDKDLNDLPILTRKTILSKIKDNNYFIKSKVFKLNGLKLFDFVKKNNLEGIVAKKINSIYEINKRSSSWIKMKNYCEEEFLIGGYEFKKNNIISILLGEIINKKLHYVGSVTVTSNISLYNDILSIKKNKTSPFIDYQRENTFYIKPILKCTVKYMERTNSNHLRQPVLKR